MPPVTPQGPSGPPRLVLRPVRGLRYQRDAVGDLAAVTSPPYDVLDRDAVLTLESADPHNVVRLILPRDEESGPEGRYEHAAVTLRRWIDQGLLRPDPEPGLYVYEQSAGGQVLQRGLIGAVVLHDFADRVVLPHEDVMPGPVADRLELMRALGANVEPILLMYDGAGGEAADVIERAADRAPGVQTTTSDGITHSMWRLTDPRELDLVARDLAERQALIADGHHRYAAYRALQSEHAPTEGPWDAGLALLVDLRAYPPHVGAIHRVVAELDLEEAVALASPLFDAGQPGADEPVRGAFVLHDGHGRVVRLVPRDAELVRNRVRGPTQWRGLDTAVLHDVVLAQLWDVADERITYHHTLDQALARARADTGVAIELAPVDPAVVLALAADGVRMPRKSTSFGPKPRTGLVIRTFDKD
jgi:uncharacterized protein (DUF1015 family)